MKALLLVCGLIALTSCGIYRFPTEDNIATLPNANNPMLTREKTPTLIPGK